MSQRLLKKWKPIIGSDKPKRNQEDFELISPKKYHTASTIHKTAPRYSTMDTKQSAHFSHTPITAQDGNMLQYIEILVPQLKESASLPSLSAAVPKALSPLKKSASKASPMKSAKKAPPIKTPHGLEQQAGFFNDQLTVPVAEETGSVQDLRWRAELGVPAGDLEREARMSLALGLKYETERNPSQALRFYKRLFYTSQLMQHVEYTSTALNRLAVLYYNRGRFKKALSLHQLHHQLAPNDFIPRYNIGLTYRCIGNLDASVEYLQLALESAEEIQDIEGRCITESQLGLTETARSNYILSKSHMEKALQYAIRLRRVQIEVELITSLGYISSYAGDLRATQKYFEMGMMRTKGDRSEICRVNLGIARADMQFEDVKKAKLAMTEDI